MSATEADYTIIKQAHMNRLGQDGSVTPGYEISVRDTQTGVTFPVFLPDDKYTADNAKLLIQDQLARVREVHSLTN